MIIEIIICWIFAGFLVGFAIEYFISRYKMKTHNLLDKKGCLINLSKKKYPKNSKKDEKRVNRFNIARAVISLPYAFSIMLKECGL